MNSLLTIIKLSILVNMFKKEYLADDNPQKMLSKIYKADQVGIFLSIIQLGYI